MTTGTFLYSDHLSCFFVSGFTSTVRYGTWRCKCRFAGILMSISSFKFHERGFFSSSLHYMQHLREVRMLLRSNAHLFDLSFRISSHLGRARNEAFAMKPWTSIVELPSSIGEGLDYYGDSLANKGLCYHVNSGCTA